MRKIVRTLIERIPDFEICAEAQDSDEAHALAKSHRPDVAVIDISLPSSNGIDLTKKLRRHLPAMPILILTMHNEEIFVDQALRAGAAGYLMKQEAAEKIHEALQCIMAGKLYVTVRTKQKSSR
jgi:DNA-binding NarL/FixJ family response regulator